MLLDCSNQIILKYGLSSIQELYHCLYKISGEADYVENDHMVVITLENDNLLGDIYLYGKPEPDSTIYDTTKENDLYVMRNIQVYR